MYISELLSQKYTALDRFRELVLSSDVKDQVASIILFGSVLKGDARTDSDIDVLVFGFGDIRKLLETCAEIAFDIVTESAELVQPLIYSVYDLLYPRSHFILRVIQEGREIFKMNEDEFKVNEMNGYLNMAQEYLDVAQNSLNEGKFRVAVDTAFNVAEICTRALLLLKLEDIPASHGGVVNKFSELYVMTGLASKKIGRNLNIMMEFRSKARYDVYALIDETIAKSAIELAETMMELLKNLKAE